MKPASKQQIQAIKEQLQTKLNTKIKQIAKEKFVQAAKKYEKDLKEIKLSADKTVEKILKLKNKLHKENKKLTIDESQLNNKSFQLPEVDMENDDEYQHQDLNSIITSKGDSYYNQFCAFKPNTKKEEAMIENYIFELTVGTALVTDMQKLIEALEKIK
jgi:uncharacterized protein YfbU (UPF0304 family)